ncbi:MAG: BatA and WFA domain-containing protein [Pirellulales bacterium]
MFDLFRNTLAPWQWALLALVPPAIIALYFLKLKRQPLEVPSTYLWKRSIEDLHVNSLWQRLRQNLLLFLQLLLIALAMLALLRPGWEGTRLQGNRFIFLVDNSASMSATDVEGAENRLEEAKKLVGGLVDQMESGMTAMIISFADTPQVVQEFTDNRRLLRERLATIEPTVRGTDLRGALELADGLANPGRITLGAGEAEIDVVEAQPATLYIFSDGRFEDVKDFALGNLRPFGTEEEPSYVPIGSFNAENLAITAFSTRRSEAAPEERQAFVQVANFSDTEKPAVVEIQLDGQFLNAKKIDVPAGESSGVVFPLANAPAGKLTARLKNEPDPQTKRDALAQDDVGYAGLNDAQPGRVLVVSPGNVALEVALTTERARRLAGVEFKKPDVLESDQYKRDADGGAYDLIIYDQCAPAVMPRADTLFIGRLPPGPAWRGGREIASDQRSEKSPDDETNQDAAVTILPQIIDWDRAHPLLGSVELSNVDIADSLLIDPPPGAAVLIDSTAGPIAAIAPRDAYQDVVLAFEIEGRDTQGARTMNTNWPRRLSFPTFCLNVLEYLAGGTEDSQIASVRPGRPVELRTAGDVPELTVIDPAGKEHVVRRMGDDTFQFHDTHQPGVYEVRRRDQVIERFAVNLFDAQESDVRLRPTQDPDANTTRAADIRIGHVDVAASASRAPARKEVWKVVLACALFVLVFEWYIYNRRVYL